jgi:lysophospholipase L1-like esterase
MKFAARIFVPAALAMALIAGSLYQGALPARSLWDRLRGCTSSGPVKNETDLKELAQYQLMRDKIGRWNRSQPRARIVLTGDSLAAYFTPELLKRYLPGYDIANRGIPGDTTVRLLGRIESDVLRLRPQIVIISIGGNDLLNERCRSTALEYTRLLFLAIRKSRPDTRIIVVSVPPTTLDRANRVVPDYNEGLRKATESAGGVFLDLWPGLVGPSGASIDPRFAADAIHINAAGYEVWAGRMGPLLR